MDKNKEKKKTLTISSSFKKKVDPSSFAERSNRKSFAISNNKKISLRGSKNFKKTGAMDPIKKDYSDSRNKNLQENSLNNKQLKLSLKRMKSPREK